MLILRLVKEYPHRQRNVEVIMKNRKSIIGKITNMSSYSKTKIKRKGVRTATIRRKTYETIKYKRNRFR